MPTKTTHIHDAAGHLVIVNKNQALREIFHGFIGSAFSNENEYLYQYLEKRHLDPDNKVTEDQWSAFVRMIQGTFFTACSEIGSECFEAFLEELEEEN